MNELVQKEMPYSYYRKHIDKSNIKSSYYIKRSSPQYKSFINLEEVTGEKTLLALKRNC